MFGFEKCITPNLKMFGFEKCITPNLKTFGFEKCIATQKIKQAWNWKSFWRLQSMCEIREYVLCN